MTLSRRHWTAAAVVVAFAVAIRLLYLWTIPWHGNDLIVHEPDAYALTALTLSRHHFAAAALFRSVAVYQFVKPPLYTVMLAATSRLPGDYPRHVAVLQAFLGGAMVAAMFWI